MTWKRPWEVISPKDRLGPFVVHHEGTPGGAALAVGTWDGEERILLRWNGNERK
jgi:hypothetical protein